jgi:hypothetical protein
LFQSSLAGFIDASVPGDTRVKSGHYEKGALPARINAFEGRAINVLYSRRIDPGMMAEVRSDLQMVHYEKVRGNRGRADDPARVPKLSSIENAGFSNMGVYPMCIQTR